MGLALSGNGSDGSCGVQAIREAGGITLAQEPSSAKYDSMPVQAVRTGCVDLVLTPQQIGKNLARILSHPRDFDGLKKMGEEATRNADLFQILQSHTMVDFRQYKESTVNRRVHRRMVANEELITVNEELIVNSTELQRTTAELNGIVDGLPTTMLMLDQGLLIRHALRRAIEQFHLRTRGQSMGHLSQCYLPEGFPPVVDLCAQALLNASPCRASSTAARGATR